MLIDLKKYFSGENVEQKIDYFIDLSSEEIVSCVDVPEYGASYRGHALHRLVKMAEENDTRSECLVMWY